MNRSQIIGRAKGKLELPDAEYGLILRNVGKCQADDNGEFHAANLDNRGFEKVIVFLEQLAAERGVSIGADPCYWRNRLGDGYNHMRHFAAILFEQYEEFAPWHPAALHYEFSGLIFRASGDVTRDIEQLGGQELYRLIETLKSMVHRVTAASDWDSLDAPRRNAGILPASRRPRKPSAFVRPQPVPVPESDIPF